MTFRTCFLAISLMTPFLLAAQQTSYQSPMENPDFELPEVSEPIGRFEGWTTNSLNGTGTYALPYDIFPKTQDGKQAAVLFPNGFIGQVVMNQKGEPLAITPGTRINVTFQFSVPVESPSLSYAVYLQSGNQEGGRVAEPVGFQEADITEGEVSLDFTIFDATTLSTSASDWETQPVFLVFRNFTGHAIIDDVKVSVTPVAD